MAFTITLWFALIQGIIISIASLIFVIVMLHNYAKKRTIGTALLALMYLAIFVRQLANVLFNYFSATNPFGFAQEISLTVYLFGLILIFVFLYNFSSRHILKDNDVIRLMTNIMLIGVSFALISLISYEMITNVENPIFSKPSFQTGTEIQQQLPTTTASLIFYIPLLVLVQFRLLFRMSYTLIRKKQKDPVRQKGFLFILLSVITLFVTMLLTMLFTLSGLSDFATTTLYVTRSIFTFLTLFFSYVGWILPNWFKRRMRQKSWIAKQITPGKQPTGKYMSSTTMIESTKIIKEVTEV
jgi:hypothetical protein